MLKQFKNVNQNACTQKWHSEGKRKADNLDQPRIIKINKNDKNNTISIVIS